MSQASLEIKFDCSVRPKNSLLYTELFSNELCETLFCRVLRVTLKYEGLRFTELIYKMTGFVENN